MYMHMDLDYAQNPWANNMQLHEATLTLVLRG